MKIIGNIDLSEEEKEVLKLHVKFSIMENLKEGDLDGEQEASIAKQRMEIEKDKKYEDYTLEERKEDEEIEAMGRMIFNPEERSFDVRRRRVTDLRECARITMPKPLSDEEESRIEVRRRIQKDTFEQYRKKPSQTRFAIFFGDAFVFYYQI